MARGTQAAGSDIDLLVVGAIGFKEVVKALYPAQESLQREINPVVYSPKEFRLRRNGTFVHEVLGKPMVFLLGDKHDLGELAGDTAPAAAHR